MDPDLRTASQFRKVGAFADPMGKSQPRSSPISSNTFKNRGMGSFKAIRMRKVLSPFGSRFCTFLHFFALFLRFGSQHPPWVLCAQPPCEKNLWGVFGRRLCPYPHYAQRFSPILRLYIFCHIVFKTCLWHVLTHLFFSARKMQKTLKAQASVSKLEPSQIRSPSRRHGLIQSLQRHQGIDEWEALKLSV